MDFTKVKTRSEEDVCAPTVEEVAWAAEFAAVVARKPKSWYIETDPASCCCSDSKVNVGTIFVVSEYGRDVATIDVP